MEPSLLTPTVSRAVYRDGVARLRERIAERALEEKRDVQITYLILRYFPALQAEQPGEARSEAEKLLSALLPLNDQFAVALIEGKTVVLDMYSILPPREDELNRAVQAATVVKAYPTAMEFQSLERLYKDSAVRIHQKKTPSLMNLATIWLEWPDRRKFERGLIFAPGVPQEQLPGRLNLFTGWNIEPDGSTDQTADEEACSEFLHHLKSVVCGSDETVYRWLLWWMADIVQNPQEKPGSAVVLAGKKGCGKSTVADVLREVIGQKYFIRLSKKAELVGSFNAYFACALVVNGEEVMFGGDVAANDTLKDMITSPTILVNEKFLPAQTMRSYSRFLFTTNSHYSHNTSEDERRFLFLDVEDTFVGDEAYWNGLYGQLRHGGFDAFARILHRMEKPEGVNLRKPPKTTAHARLFAESLSIEERFFFNALVNGEDYPEAARENGGIVFVSDIKVAFEEYLNAQGKARSHKRTDNNFIPNCMRKFWAAECQPRKVRAGRKEACYLLPSLTEARDVATMAIEHGGQLGLPPEAVGMDDDE